MPDVPQNGGGRQDEDPAPAGRGSLLGRQVKVPAVAIVLLLIAAAGIGVGITFLTGGTVTHSGSASCGGGQRVSTPSSAQVTAPVSPPSTLVSPLPAVSPGNSVIPMSAACEWAYPGKATGQISGSDYSIVCLGAGGQVLGGFGGAHSLNAWCADPAHTGGGQLPNPALLKGMWMCTP